MLFLETGYHFPETYSYRDEMTNRMHLNLVNLAAKMPVAEQESQFGILNQTAPDRCCGIRKVEPLFRGLSDYGVWFTALRREQSPTRANLAALDHFKLPTGHQLLKVSPLADWTNADVWAYLKRRSNSSAAALRSGSTPASAARLAPLLPSIRIIRARAAGAAKSWNAAFTSRATKQWKSFLDSSLPVAIGMTGVGAGVITAPVLILFLHVPPARAVGTALAFSVAVKLLVVPMQIYRKQGGLPGLGLPAGGRHSRRARGIVYFGETRYQRLARNFVRRSRIDGGRDGGCESLPPVAPSSPARIARFVTLASGNRFAYRRGGWLFVGGRRSNRIAGAALADAALGRAGGGNGSLLWSLSVAGRQRFSTERGQL